MRISLRKLIATLVVLVCAMVGVFAWKVYAATYPKLPDNIELHRDLVYAIRDGIELKLDIARAKDSKGKQPLLLCIHGGGWSSGNKESMYGPIPGFTQAGVTCATVQYRLLPKYRFPNQLEDVKVAIRWLRANAEKYQIDPDRMGVIGVSAGAHLAALVATTADSKEFSNGGENEDQSDAVAAAICLAGPYDLALAYKNKDKQGLMERHTIESVIPALTGGFPDAVPEEYVKASPVSYVKKEVPPMLLVHGTADTLVLLEQAEVYYSKLEEAGADVTLLRLPGGTHVSFGPDHEKAVKTIGEFVLKHLKVQP